VTALTLQEVAVGLLSDHLGHCVLTGRLRRWHPAPLPTTGAVTAEPLAETGRREFRAVRRQIGHEFGIELTEGVSPPTVPRGPGSGTV
jgi:hypothetical protein